MYPVTFLPCDLLSPLVWPRLPHSFLYSLWIFLHHYLQVASWVVKVCPEGGTSKGSMCPELSAKRSLAIRAPSATCPLQLLAAYMTWTCSWSIAPCLVSWLIGISVKELIPRGCRKSPSGIAWVHILIVVPAPLCPVGVANSLYEVRFFLEPFSDVWFPPEDSSY